MIIRPIPLTPIFDNIPSTLTDLPNWVLWRYAMKDGKWTKVPVQPNGNWAKTNAPTTWCTFDQALAAYQRGGFDGVGIVLTGKPIDNGHYLIGLDFDHCLAENVFDNDPIKAIMLLDTYSEISPSETGIRIFLLHNKPTTACKINVDGKSREVYSTGRYLTVTGHVIGQHREVRYVI